ncbi:hypothetical protein H4R19_003434 [Coemansia spiralis]|nr:hypothetical protein H4R19_003434 [Coemansia spiralis]
MRRFPPSSDSELATIDYEKIHQEFAQRPIPATHLAPSVGRWQRHAIRADAVGVDPSAMAGIGLAEREFRALAEADTAAAAAGHPRMLEYEVVAACASHGEDGSNAEPVVDPMPLAESERILLHFHGGGYVSGSPGSHRKAVGQVARAGGRRCFVVDYRLAPRYPFPAQLHDALIAYRHLLTLGYSAANIIVAGDSAGGHIALGLMLLLKHMAADPLPGAALLLAPQTAVDLRGASLVTNGPYDYMANTPLTWPTSPMRMFYAPGRPLSDEYRRETRHPLLEPANADLTGLPPTLIQVGERDMLIDDIKLFADALARAIGPNARYEEYPEMVHVFQRFVHHPVAVRAFASIGDFLKAN